MFQAEKLDPDILDTANVVASGARLAVIRLGDKVADAIRDRQAALATATDQAFLAEARLIRERTGHVAGGPGPRWKRPQPMWPTMLARPRGAAAERGAAPGQGSTREGGLRSMADWSLG